MELKLLNLTAVTAELDMNILRLHNSLELIRDRVYLILFRFERKIKFLYPVNYELVRETHGLDLWENSVIIPVNKFQRVKKYISDVLSEFPLYTLREEPLDNTLKSVAALSFEYQDCPVLPLLLKVKIVTNSNCEESHVPIVLSEIHSLKKPPKQIYTSLLQLWVRRYSSQVTNSEEQCAICFEKFGGTDDQNSSMALTLHCSHMFHSGCIFNWLDNNLSCPLCRIDVLIL